MPGLLTTRRPHPRHAKRASSQAAASQLRAWLFRLTAVVTHAICPWTRKIHLDRHGHDESRDRARLRTWRANRPRWLAALAEEVRRQQYLPACRKWFFSAPCDAHLVAVSSAQRASGGELGGRFACFFRAAAFSVR